MVDISKLGDDERRLAELGYKQELDRSWSGFSNFAISFSIISILSGCFTTFGQAWNNGGAIAISIGWPIIAALILVIGLCMSELVSAMPTSGGIYYWSFKLGKPVHGWLTGWLNLFNLLPVFGLDGRIREVVDAGAEQANRAMAGLRAREQVHDQPALFMRAALEFNAENVAHLASRAIATGEKWRAYLVSSLSAGQGDGDALRILGKTFHNRFKPRFDVRKTL